MQKLRPVLLAFVAVVVVVGLYKVAVALRRPPAVDATKPSTQSTASQLFDPEPYAPVCAYWAPWRRLVAPGEPRDYLTRIKRRLEEPSARSGEYKKMIEQAHSVLSGTTEKVCISGRTVADGTYHMDAFDAKTCNTPPERFLEANTTIAVEKQDDDSFINDIEIAVGMEQVRPEAVLTFLKEEVALLHSGYHGWSKAFPNYFEVNRAGLGLTDFKETPAGEARVTYLWLNQSMRQWLPGWADYLLRLSDLVSINTTFKGKDGQTLFETRVDTAQSGMDVSLPPAAAVYLVSPTAIPLTVEHNITVRFRGLNIALRGMRFSGELTPSPGHLVYGGRFTGVDDVVITGAYRGVSGGSIGKMIFELVQEAVRKELMRLTKGNHGRGWDFRIAHDTTGTTNVFTYHTSLQSPVNFLNLIREDKDRTDSPVMPSVQSLTDLNRWATKTVDGFLADATQNPCPLAQ